MMPILGLRPPGGDVCVELVGAHEGEHGIALVIVQPRFLAEDGVAQADVEPAFRHQEILGDDDIDALEAAVDHGGRFHRLVHAI